jgi:sec-independent protein translocase protein TatB
MEILGVGPLELLFIFLIALIVLGPKDMAKTGRTLGRFMYKVVTSPAWQTFRQASRDLRQLPTKLMREAGLEEQELQKLSQEMGLKDGFGISRQDLSLSSWTTTPPETNSTNSPSNSIESSEGQTKTVETVLGTENLIGIPDTVDEVGSLTNDNGSSDLAEPISSESVQSQITEDQAPVDEVSEEHLSELDQTQQTESS